MSSFKESFIGGDTVKRLAGSDLSLIVRSSIGLVGRDLEVRRGVGA